MSETSFEKKIVASALLSRNAYTRVVAASDVNTAYTPYSSFVLKLIGRYYDRDEKAQAVDRDVLVHWMEEQLPPKNQELYINYLKECSGIDVSAINIADVVVAARKKHLGNQIAVALHTPGEDASELMQEYQGLTAEDEQEKEADINDVSIFDMIASAEDGEGRIRLSPPALDKCVKGRTRRGHHLVVFARPETGKTAITLTMACGMALQNLKVGIIGNEEPIVITRMRAACCLTGLSEEQIIANPKAAEELLSKRGWSNMKFFSLSPGTLRDVDDIVDKHKLDVAIVDQIRNLSVGAETRVNQLEMAATGVRNIGKKRNCLMISVTQAGDSASNKLVLDMNDVDYSNTGIPATADLMIGMGVNREYETNGMRMISLPKNKIGGTHDNFLVAINSQLSQLRDI